MFPYLQPHSSIHPPFQGCDFPKVVGFLCCIKLFLVISSHLGGEGDHYYFFPLHICPFVIWAWLHFQPQIVTHQHWPSFTNILVTNFWNFPPSMSYSLKALCALLISFLLSRESFPQLIPTHLSRLSLNILFSGKSSHTTPLRLLASPHLQIFSNYCYFQWL